MSPVPKIRVLIADDHAVLRAGLRLLIGTQADLEVVDEAGDGEEAVRRTMQSKPDLVLLDLSMPGPRGTRTIERLVRLDPSPRVLVLTMHDDPAYCESALQAGAAGYIVKKAADVELLTAIRAVHRGRTFVDLTRPGRPTEGRSIPRPSSPPSATARRKELSRRETDVLRLLARGHTNQATAALLAISVKTVETHRKRLSDKLGLKSRAELFRFAVGSGLLEPADVTDEA